MNGDAEKAKFISYMFSKLTDEAIQTCLSPKVLEEFVYIFVHLYDEHYPLVDDDVSQRTLHCPRRDAQYG